MMNWKTKPNTLICETEPKFGHLELVVPRLLGEVKS